MSIPLPTSNPGALITTVGGIHACRIAVYVNSIAALEVRTAAQCRTQRRFREDSGILALFLSAGIPGIFAQNLPLWSLRPSLTVGMTKIPKIPGLFCYFTACIPWWTSEDSASPDTPPLEIALFGPPVRRGLAEQ